MATNYNPRIVTENLVLLLDAANNKSILSAVEVLVVAGGGAGGGYHGGGGGGGGVIYSSSHSITPGSAITATVGAGGGAPNSSSNTGNPGGNSVFGALTAIGGGAGISQSYEAQARNNGGSGGGGCDGSASVNHPGGSGTSGQGFKGGDVFGSGPQLAVSYGTAGGGGAGGVGGDGGVINGGFGGSGLPFSISGNLAYYAGGGGGTHLGSSSITNYGIGGIGGGGTGGISPSPHNSAIRNSSSGVDGTGGGGGGHLYYNLGGGAGGSGIIIVRYPGSQRATGGTVTSVGGYTIHTFTTSGTFTPTWGDMSTNGNSGTLVNGVGYSASNGGALSFDGVDDYVTLGSKSFLSGNASFTLSMWVYFNILTNGEYYTLFSYGGFVSGGWLFQRQGGNTWRFAFNGDSLYDTSTIFSTTGEWKHIVVTVNNGIPQRVYVDNNFESFSSGSGTLNITNPKNIEICRRTDSTSQYINGNIAQTQIYNRALTAAEVSQNFNSNRFRYGL